jgi:1-deoxy-D-xylulose-5-phosphate reductoisomerase
MGRKITIDSATLMNKALEMIEAKWLFDLKAEQIDMILHPESIVHSFVEYRDGSVMAQLSPPDMRLPIQYALFHPERPAGPAKRLNWQALKCLNFSQPDFEAFPAPKLARRVLEEGGTTGAVLNAANEAAVERFLNGTLRFLDIASACQKVLEAHNFLSTPNLEELLAADRWARQEVEQWS